MGLETKKRPHLARTGRKLIPHKLPNMDTRSGWTEGVGRADSRIVATHVLSGHTAMNDKGDDKTKGDITSTDGTDKGAPTPYLPKRRKGQSSKGASKPKVTPTKRPVKLMLDTSDYETLFVHSLRRGMNLSELVGELIRKNLTEWTIHARPGSKDR